METRIEDELSVLGALDFARSLAKARGVRLSDVLTVKDRRSRVTRVRRELWSVVHGSLGLAANETARVFGVDHASVLSALKKREKELGYAQRA